MIITQLAGGLGNQLFQYAAARSLALTHGVGLKCDLSFYSSQADRAFKLDKFHTQYEIAHPSEIAAHIPNSRFEKLLLRLKPAHRRTVYREPHFHFDPHFYKAGKKVYLRGNWQSEKYFIRHENIIRAELKPAITFSREVEAVRQKIHLCNSVAVHIRRGDYLKPEVLAFHGILPNTYYNQAIAHLRNRISEPVLYFFSDDMDWVQKHIRLDLPHHFVSGNETQTDLEDFWLMQQCRHQIIANSSFSWWAAWLNEHKGKQVVAPKHWFGPKGPKDTADIVPATWTKL